jgi:SAM-dependent methyltransferase
MGLRALRFEVEECHFEWLRVRRELNRLSAGTDPYIIRMWDEALAEADGIERAPHSDPLVFPYVPFSPEQFGLRLSPESRLLDVGCLGGFGLFDFTVRRLRMGSPVPVMFAVDLDPSSLALGEALARTWAKPGQLTFQRATGEVLPHASQSFDLVIARSVLQYLQIRPAMEELARVARPGALMLIQVHGPGYYLHQVVRHMERPLQAAYYARALASGLLFSASGMQFHHRWFKESAMTDHRLMSLARSLGMKRLWTNHDLRRPLSVFVKE